MSTIIASLRRGRGKAASYLLAAFFAFAAAQSAQAANYNQYYWTGSGDGYWETDANWVSGTTTTQAYRGHHFNRTATTKTVKFKQANSVDGRIAVEGTGNGSTDADPYVFLADADDFGVTLTGSNCDFEIGSYKIGHLHIMRGTYECAVLKAGNAENNGSVPLVIGGGENHATLKTTYASGAVLVQKGTVKVLANGTLDCTGRMKIGATSGQAGELLVDGGTVPFSGDYLCVGAGGTGTLTINSGNVSHTGSNDIPIGDSSTGTVTVKSGGKLCNSGSATGMRVACSGAGTLNVQGGEVELTKGGINLCASSGKTVNATINVTEGGTLTTSSISHGAGSGAATMTLNGGTIKAYAGSESFIPAHNNFQVYVGANGGTIDANGNGIAISEPLLEDGSSQGGGMTFKGGGTVTLGGGNTYTGTTTVEVGTTLIVPAPSDIGGGLVATIPSELPDGTHTIVSLSGEGSLASFFASATFPANDPKANFGITSDNKTIYCVYGNGGPVWIGGSSGSLSDPANWANNAVPGSGTNCVIGNAAPATLTVGDTFAASSITFAEDSAAITINAAASESITGIVVVTNLSPAVQTFACQLTFADNYRVHCATQPVNFSGGATATCPASDMTDNAASHTLKGNITFTADWTQGQLSNSYKVPSGSHLYAKDVRGTSTSGGQGGCFLVVEAGGVVDCESAFACFGKSRLSVKGELNVTGLYTAGETSVSGSSSNTHVGFDGDENGAGILRASGVWKRSHSQVYVKVPTLYIGADGIGSKENDYAIHFDGKPHTVYATDNFEIFGNARAGYLWDWGIAIDQPVTFNTQGHTITWTGGADGSGALVKDGDGTLIFNPYGTRLSGAVTVKAGTLKVMSASGVGTGAMTVEDGATLEIASGATLGTAPLTLEAGSTFVVPSADLPIPVASLTLPESGKATIQIAGNAAYLDGDYEVLFVTGGLPAGFAEKINVVLPDGTSENRRLYTTDNGTMRLIVGNGAVPDPYTWTGAANDGRMNTPGNWRCGAVPPAGATVFIQPRGGEIVNDIENFAPSSITIGYGSALTISGNAITGVVAITNLSTTTSHTINAPVAFADKIFVVQGAMSWEQKANPSINFAGGVTGTTFANGTARYLNGAFTLTTGSGWVANTQGNNTRWGIPAGSSLTLPSATDTSELALGDSSTSGGAFTTGVLRTSARLLCWNYGEYVVTNEFTATFPASDVHYCGHENISNGKYKFEKMTLEGTYNSPFKFGNGYNAADAGTQRFLIGSGGLCFADGASQNLRYETGGANNNSTVRIDPWHGDYTIHTKSASNPTDFTVSANTYFGTTDEDGNACMVTDEGVINSYGSAADINIDGNGKFVVNAVCAATCSVTVTNTATLAINAGKKLTTGATTVNDGATLEVAESGTVALGGDLTLKAGAQLGFNYTTLNKPVLDLTGKTVTFDTGATTNVIVKISADEGKRARSGVNVLTSGGKFADATVSLAPGAPDWVKDVSVVDGNIVLDVKNIGMMILVY